MFSSYAHKNTSLAAKEGSAANAPPLPPLNPPLIYLGMSLLTSKLPECASAMAFHQTNLIWTVINYYITGYPGNFMCEQCIPGSHESRET